MDNRFLGLLLRRTVVLNEPELDGEFVRSVIDTTTAAYAEMRADEAAWAQEQAERAVLERSLSDGLED
jgi:hypothetical protein